MNAARNANPGALLIGWATRDITPEEPVSLYGQYYERISQYIQSPLKVIACAFETVDESGEKHQAILISLDLIFLLPSLRDAVSTSVQRSLPDFDAAMLVMNATHTHSAPYPDVESEYGRLLVERISGAAVAAWQQRNQGGISNAFGYAVVGHNRRALYRDGTAEMYGDTTREDFIGMEGASDPGVDMLFCWDRKNKLTGVILNVSCPAQVTEAKYFVSSDYWGEVRKQLKEAFSEDIFVLAQCGAAGDISPRDLSTAYKAGEANMWDIPGTIEIGKRLTMVVTEAYKKARHTIEPNVTFRHTVHTLSLSPRKVSGPEYEKALSIVNEIRSREPADPHGPGSAWDRFLQEIRQNEKLKKFGPWDSKTSDFGWLKSQEQVLEQFKGQDKGLDYNMELHVLRIGNVAMATNPFELFVDYGVAITARSRAMQTFIVQLVGDYGGYLATQKALEGGGYSAMANHIGPEGGWVLVEETIKVINSMW